MTQTLIAKKYFLINDSDTQSHKISEVICSSHLSANHPVHPCAPDKISARAYTENPQKMRMHAHNSVHTYPINPNFADQ